MRAGLAFAVGLIVVCLLVAAAALAYVRGQTMLAALIVAALLVGGTAAMVPRVAQEPPDLRLLPPPRPPQPDDSIGIEALADPAILIDARLFVAHANASARALLGDRIIGDDLRVGLRHPAVIEATIEARDRHSASTRELVGFARPENIFRLRAIELADQRVLLTFADITQARLTERMRVDFVANASHELKTPLATILGFIETLEGPAAEDEPARARFLEIMAREARRMARLIDDLLSLSRIELDKYVPPRTPIAVGPLVHDVGKTLAVRLEGDQRVLRAEFADTLPEAIGDRDQILQVLHNLISNALKYGRSGTPIIVRAEVLAARAARSEPMIRVSVEDQGDGIAPEHLPRLTERFYRVDSGRSRSVGGTGLGLAIVKHIVERHRGQLGIVSKPGEGTVVSFTLPEARGGGGTDAQDDGAAH